MVFHYILIISTISTCVHWPYVCICPKIDRDQMSGWTKRRPIVSTGIQTQDSSKSVANIAMYLGQFAEKGVEIPHVATSSHP